MPTTHPADFECRISNFEFSEALRETARVQRRCLASRHDVVLNVMSACLASSRGSASPEHKHGCGHGNGSAAVKDCERQAGQSPTKAPGSLVVHASRVHMQARRLHHKGALPVRGTRPYSPRFALPAPSTHHNQPRMKYSLLPLGKSRRARPDVAFRGRVGGGWGREIGGRRRPGARMQPAGAPQARSPEVPGIPIRHESACLASSRGSAPQGHKHGRGHGNGQSRGRRPRTAGEHGDWTINRRCLGRWLVEPDRIHRSGMGGTFRFF